MLESIFGKSKKSKQKSTEDSSSTTNDNDGNSGYVMINDPNRSPYPQTLMLNDELIKMGNQSSVYPSLDPTLPYSTVAAGGGGASNHGHQHLLHGHKQTNSICRTCSPIDNIPFQLTNYNGSDNNGNNNQMDDDEREILSMLSRIESFLDTYKYEFDLENSILRETM